MAKKVRKGSKSRSKPRSLGMGKPNEVSASDVKNLSEASASDLDRTLGKTKPAVRKLWVQLTEDRIKELREVAFDRRTHVSGLLAEIVDQWSQTRKEGN